MDAVADKNSYFLGKNGEIVYSKNNVCVHEATENSQLSVSACCITDRLHRSVFQDEDIVQHIPGYLTVRCQDDDLRGVTLVLQWLPNSTLERNPSR